MTASARRRAVFLDRDGVLIRTPVVHGTPHPVNSVSEVEILPGVRQALELLAAHGLPRIVVTNQPDVRRGTQTREAVEQIHAYLMRELPLSGIFTCYHDDRDDCACRKPKPGLLLQAAKEYNLDVGRSFLVGDRWKDIEAGRAAACATFLLGDGYGEAGRCLPDHIVDDLLAAARQIVELLKTA